MTEAELNTLTLVDAARRIRLGELSPVDLTRAVLDRIVALDSQVNAFITVTAEQALDEAKKAEEILAAGDNVGPLHGIPVSLKDLIDTRNVPTTAGSQVLADRVPVSDATVATRLRAAGAILVGKTNMHEFAYGVTSANVHYGPVRNPWDPGRVAGGSSGGSAVSVSLSMALGSLGTDTGGSIRIPAALSGTVGLKPTHGRVSGAGIIPLVDAFDTFGPIARTVEDAALLLDVIAAADDLDARTQSAPEFACTGSLAGGVGGFRLGVPRGAFDRTDTEVEKCVRSALELLKELGATLVDVDLKGPELHETVFRTIAGSEVFAFHEEYLKQSPGAYGPDTRERIEAGRHVTDEERAAAWNDLADLKAELADCFDQVDLLVLPTVPIPAPPIGQAEIRVGGRDESVLATLTRHTRLFSITGVPAISVPCGLTSAHLPVGLQIAGPAFAEARILQAAFAYEQESGGFKQRPALARGPV